MHMQLARTWLGTLTLASLSLLGCNVEDDSVDEGTSESAGEAGSPEEDLGTAEQMFAAFGYSSATATSGNASTVLGTWSGNAAYLMGVTGNLSDGGNVAMYNSFGNARVGAHAGNGYSVRAYGGLANPGVVSGEYGYANNSYATSNPDVLMGTSNGNRRCFLTQVINYPGSDNFNNNIDWIGIKQVGTNWYLYGQGKVAGFARCVTVTTPLGETYWGGAGSQNLGPAVTGKTCWLRGIGGILRGNVSTGVIVQYDGGPQMRWEMNTAANTAGHVECNI